MSVTFGFWGVGILTLWLIAHFPVALFLLMEFISYHAGLTIGLFEAAKVMLRKVPGGLAISSIFACSGFAAVSGSSLATAAAMGRIVIPEMVVLVFLVFVTGGLNWDAIQKSLLETVMTTSSLFIIAVGAAMFTRFLGLTGLSSFLNSTIAGADLSYFELMLIIVLIYLVLGTFMEPFGAMLVTLPVFLLILQTERISLVWFGVLVVKLLEIGMIAPPVGLNVFVIRNVASDYVTVAPLFRWNF